MLKQSVILLACVCIAFADSLQWIDPSEIARAIGLKPFEPKPSLYQDVPGCYIKELDGVLRFGTGSVSKVGCQYIWCTENGPQYVTCKDVAVAEPPCYVVERPTLPYPRCCKKVSCEED